MKRRTALPALLSIYALVAVAACSSGDNKAADTTAVADTSMAAPTTTASTTTVTTDTSTAAIVPININTATDAEILKIPGVGPRMLREFKEYRPYTSIEQFRREIGKYVDKAEVARLEKYIVIK
jgi:DNA uptake protein ComE-like DNA-binding protein